MNTHQLEIFFYVAKFLSVSKAAKHLYVSQPAVSAQIKKLESTYEVKLLQRNGRGIQLTYTGEQLYEIIRPFFLNSLADAEALLKNSSHLKISGNYLMTQFIVPEVLGNKYGSVSNEKIVVKSMSSINAIKELEKDYCDLVLISASEAIIPQVDFEVVELFDNEIIFISKNNIEHEVTSIIVSKSKKDIRGFSCDETDDLSSLPVTVVDSTQDAIANIRINRESGTFVSACFLKYFKENFNYRTTGINSKFYAIYRKESSKIKLIHHVIDTIKSSFK